MSDFLPAQCWVSSYGNEFVLSVTVPILGLPVTRQLLVARGRVYVPDAYHAYKRQLRRMLSLALREKWADFPLDIAPTELAIALTLHCREDKRIDLDNALKPVVDAVAALWGVDDTIKTVRFVSASVRIPYALEEDAHAGGLEMHEVSMRAIYPANDTTDALATYVEGVQDDIPF